jgi:hypothetical protein
MANSLVIHRLSNTEREMVLPQQPPQSPSEVALQVALNASIKILAKKQEQLPGPGLKFVLVSSNRMGYCFQLRLHDVSGNYLECFEYAGSYSIETVFGFLNKLRELCLEAWNPLPEGAMYFLPDIEYQFVECVEILEALETLNEALEEGRLKWTEDTETRDHMFKDILKMFRKAVDGQGYILQTLA